METNIFNRLMRNHSLPFVPALDPFKLPEDELLVRLAMLETLGSTVAFLASTDDEAYDDVVPKLVHKLKENSKTTILEHFRPKRETGFRRSSPVGAVLMSRVLTSDDDFYKNCSLVQGIGNISNLSKNERYDTGLFISGAVVFGQDTKSQQYVSSRITNKNINVELENELLSHLENIDVLYLFSRNSRLCSSTVESVRSIVGDGIPIIASGCIRSCEDIHSLRAAGATQVVVGSLLENSMWKESAIELASATKATR